MSKEAQDWAVENLGMDTPRLWATQCSVHQSGPLTLMVFRETANVTFAAEDGSDERTEVRKNVASILMTNENAETLGRILYDHFSKDKDADGE